MLLKALCLATLIFTLNCEDVTSGNNSSVVTTRNKVEGILNGLNRNVETSVHTKIDNAILKTTRKVNLNMKQGLTMNQLLRIYALTEVENERCKNDSLDFAAGLRNFEPWALKMFDASSKLQSGILLGNLVEYGSFKQCIRIHKYTTRGIIRGKHCTLRIFPDVNLLKKILSYMNITERRWQKVKTFVDGATLDWSVCLPDSCDSPDVLKHFEKIVLELTEGLNLTVSLQEFNCVTAHDEKPFTKLELSIIAAFCVYIMTIVACTLIDIYSHAFSGSMFINVFSAYQNSKQIFSNSNDFNDMDCIHGIRFLSTCYVIIGHRFLMLMFFPTINSLEILDWILYYRSTAITGGTLCVDTFFMISGMLVSVGYFKQVSKGNMNWIIFYLYRYMRITPPLAIVILWISVLMHHFGSGPLWRDMLEIIQKPCQDYWWATILHIQNYVHPFPLCMTQTWYLTCDMQYYFMSPLILIPFRKYRILGYLNYCVVYLMAIASGFYFSWINKYNGAVPVTNQLFSTKYFKEYYITPHTRAATYIIGLGFGYYVYKNRGRHVKINYLVAVIGWISCISLMLVSLIGCHVFFTEEHDYERLESTLFLTLSRSSWTFGIVWMVWACINGYGGPINFVLSLHIFKFLGRISYGMYLIHMVVQYMMSGAMKMPTYFSDFYAIFASLGDLVLMILIGFFFTVFFESPLIKSLSILLKGKSERQINPHNNFSDRNKK